jgi:hypothetical protein
VLALAALAGGCGAAAVSTPEVHRARPSATVAPPARPARAAPIDRLARIARKRYAIESHGATARAKLRAVGRDPVLLRTLESGSPAAMRAYVRRRFKAVWYGMHVSRLRILRGSRVLVDVGVPFVVAPSEMTLRGRGGRVLGTLQVSIQDEIGFARFTYRNDHVYAVVRGAGSVRTLLPAAAHARLPARGTVTLAGRRYAVRSFPERTLDDAPVTVWILAPA